VALGIPPGSGVLFIGDSITDAGRDRDDPASLGSGYALMAAAAFGARHPRHGVTFVNRGIAGDRVHDLVARWDTDCLELVPDVVSVLIGVNDTWRRYDSDDETPTADYESDYRKILTRARERIDPLFILVEPFLLPMSDDQHGWRVDLDPRIGVVRRLAAEFDATLVPADGTFAAAAADAGPAVWSTDGVHLTPAGDALLARAWLRHVRPA